LDYAEILKEGRFLVKRKGLDKERREREIKIFEMEQDKVGP